MEALPSSGPVPLSVHELATPNNGKPHNVCIESQVHSLRITDTDCPRTRPVDKIPVYYRFTRPRLNEDRRGWGLRLPLGLAFGQRLLVEARSLPTDVQILSSILFEVSNLNFLETFLELDFSLLSDHAVNTVVKNDPLASDMQFGTIV